MGSAQGIVVYNVRKGWPKHFGRDCSYWQSLWSVFFCFFLLNSGKYLAQVGLLRCRQRDGVQGIKVPYRCEKISKIVSKYLLKPTQKAELLLAYMYMYSVLTRILWKKKSDFPLIFVPRVGTSVYG